MVLEVVLSSLSLLSNSFSLFIVIFTITIDNVTADSDFDGSFLNQYDVSAALDNKQCHNHFGVMGATREVLVACTIPLFNQTVSRVSRDMIDDNGNSNKKWSQECYDSFYSKGPGKTSSLPRDWRRGTNVVFSTALEFTYVDNVKAGSASIRHVLVKHGVGRNYRNLPMSKRNWSRSVTAEQNSNHFTWSLMRDPISRFLSSFQQAVKQNVCLDTLGFGSKELKNEPERQQSCFDWCVTQLLRGNIVNEHFQTQAFRILTRDAEGELLKYNFLGQLESVSLYWNHLFHQIFKGENTTSYGSDALPHQVHDGIEVSVQILPWHVLALCTIYSQDFVCFGYALPEACSNLQLHDSP